MLINLNNIAVSAYLAYTLSLRLNKEDVDTTSYDITLVLIMISAVVTAFVGKLISNKIVRIFLYFWNSSLISTGNSIKRWLTQYLILRLNFLNKIQMVVF